MFSNQRRLVNHGIEMLTEPSAGIVERTSLNNLYRVHETPSPQIGEDTKALITVSGPSRSGKDSIIAALLDGSNNNFTRVRTATSRDRRAEENQDAMVWMRKPYENENQDVYMANMVDENSLLEYSYHNGYLYGLPRISLDSVKDGDIPIINTDADGVRSLHDRLRGSYAMINFFICPPNATILEERIRALDDNVQERLDRASTYLRQAHKLSHFVIHNVQHEIPDLGAARSAANIRHALDLVLTTAS